MLVYVPRGLHGKQCVVGLLSSAIMYRVESKATIAEPGLHEIKTSGKSKSKQQVQ